MATAPALTAAARSPRVEVRPTGAGISAALLALVMLAAALNTGNNLLYLLAALVVSTLPVSIRLACRSLKAASVELWLPAEVTVGDEALAALSFRSTEGPLVGLSLQASMGEAVGLPYLAAAATTQRPLALQADRRGPRQVETTLDCLYPWGLMRARREGPSGELLVLPKPAHGAEAPVLLGLVTDGRPTRVPGQGQDLLEIRDYTPGDDARLIDWKATARREKPMLRQGAREEDRRATVVIDPSPPVSGERGRELVEEAISRAAGAVIALARGGWQVRLLDPDGDWRGSELEQLRALARLELPEQPLAAGWWHSRIPPGEPVVRCAAEQDRS